MANQKEIENACTKFQQLSLQSKPEINAEVPVRQCEPSVSTEEARTVLTPLHGNKSHRRYAPYRLPRTEEASAVTRNRLHQVNNSERYVANYPFPLTASHWPKNSDVKALRLSIKSKKGRKEEKKLNLLSNISGIDDPEGAVLSTNDRLGEASGSRNLKEGSGRILETIVEEEENELNQLEEYDTVAELSEYFGAHVSIRPRMSASAESMYL